MARSILLLFTLLTVITARAYTEGTSLTELPPGAVAPEFELIDSEGEMHRLSDYRGQVVVVNFWATWCPPCLEEMPAMQRAWEVIREENMMMLGINLGEDEDAVFEFTAEYPVEFPLLLDEAFKLPDTWPVNVLPTTYVIDTEGMLVYRAIGARGWDAPEVLDRLRDLQ